MTANTAQSATRDDYLFGVCYGIATDFGFNPIWLRILLAAGIVVNMGAALAIYAALGIVVAASRLLFRPRRTPGAPGEVVTLAITAATALPAEEPLRHAA